MINTLFFHKKKNIFPPLMVGAPALLNAASKISTIKKVGWIIERLNPKPNYVLEYYSNGIERFGEDWGYADLLTVLHVATKWVNPRSYLEIGVSWGRSASIVGALAPECTIIGIDLWKKENMHIPRENLKAVGHKGRVSLLRGDSHAILPGLKNKHFDIILVDGDHTERGASQDLIDISPLLSLGGVLVFDDISVPWLHRTWKKLIEGNSRFSTAKYPDSGAGVGIAIRRV